MSVFVMVSSNVFEICLSCNKSIYKSNRTCSSQNFKRNPKKTNTVLLHCTWWKSYAKVIDLLRARKKGNCGSWELQLCAWWFIDLSLINKNLRFFDRESEKSVKWPRSKKVNCGSWESQLCAWWIIYLSLIYKNLLFWPQTA